MEWDEVERELVVAARDLSRLGVTFEILASVLRRERLNGSKGITRATLPPAQLNEDGAEPPLPLESEVFS